MSGALEWALRRGGEGGFHCVSPSRYTPAACLKMAGDPPAAQIGKDARGRDNGTGARGFKDNKDNNDIKDAQKGQRDRRDKETEETKGRASLQSCGAATLFKTTGVKRPALSRSAGAAQAPAKAQSRHRGARSAMASAMSDLCKICGACGKYTDIAHASQEARSICLGRSEPRLPSRLCGKNTLAVLRRSRPFSCEALLKNWGKAPCAFAGCRGGGSPCISVYSVYSVVFRTPMGRHELPQSRRWCDQTMHFVKV